MKRKTIATIVFLFAFFCIVISPVTQAKAQYPANLRFEFVRIPRGEFVMGCSPDDSGCNHDENPRHRVRISKDFEMGKYLVTEAMWESVMSCQDHDNSWTIVPCLPGESKVTDRPIMGVSWNDVQVFLQRMNAKKDGYHYRLPTEAEWEYAARAGSTSARYGDLEAIAWYRDNSDGVRHPVGQKQPNAWGLYDMLGNAMQWVQDYYSAYYYVQSPGTDPQGPSSGWYRVLRGVPYGGAAMYITASRRTFDRPIDGEDGRGFRCVRERAR
jgi:formylglycine-generating enzyme required for sulfatase activity